MIPTVTIKLGDALAQLRTLPAASVHCCVTSPPYWGLRDYGVEGQLGLEKTPEEYVAKMVAVFQEVKRVLREDGTLWLNMGDSYCGGNTGNQTNVGQRYGDGKESIGHIFRRDGAFAKSIGLKPKDLCGMPWRLAFALQADGWYLRSDIIWHKPNPMPESVTDRPTKSHEYIFLLSKSERYFYDQEAVKEQSIDPESLRPEGRNLRKDDKFATAFLDEKRNGIARTRAGFSKLEGVCYPTRNKRTVWTVPSFAFPGSHFATFPPDLIKPCILAGTSAKGCCAKCGAPWERVVENTPEYAAFCESERIRKNGGMRSSELETAGLTRGSSNKSVTAERKTTGWRPTCQCNAETIPCTVLDPFGGSGTTGMVAIELGRKAILIELNPEYVALATQRCNVTPGLSLCP